MNTKELLVRAVQEGANVTMFLDALAKVRPATPQEKAVIAAAREQRHKEGEVEIDEVTVASIDEYDPGARGGYVLAWVWAEVEEEQRVSKPANLIERLTGDMECALGSAQEAADLLRKIQRALSGREWDSETPGVIAGLLDDAGIEVREFGDLLDFVVTYYEKWDEWMETPLTFCCSAEDEDHAVEQCQDAYPGCTTAYVEEIER